MADQPDPKRGREDTGRTSEEDIVDRADDEEFEELDEDEPAEDEDEDLEA